MSLPIPMSDLQPGPDPRADAPPVHQFTKAHRDVSSVGRLSHVREKSRNEHSLYHIILARNSIPGHRRHRGEEISRRNEVQEAFICPSRSCGDRRSHYPEREPKVSDVERGMWCTASRSTVSVVLSADLKNHDTGTVDGQSTMLKVRRATMRTKWGKRKEKKTTKFPLRCRYPDKKR